MTYPRPKMKYVEMAKYFDDHIADEEKDEYLLYCCVYHLVYMLACRKKYFTNLEEYDNYAIFVANKVYMRVLKGMREDNHLAPVKSVLNYIKSVLYPLKVLFTQETYQCVLKPKTIEDFNSMNDAMRNNVQQDYFNQLEDAILTQISRLPKYIEKTIGMTPYKNDKRMCYRLYMSILISFINGITLNNNTKNSLSNKSIELRSNDEYLAKLYAKEKRDSTTLWHLDDSMKDYVTLLTNKIRDDFAEELINEQSYYELPDDVLQSILLSNYTFANNITKEDMDE